MTHSPIRVVVVDDHRLVLDGIQSLMEEVDDIQIVGAAADGHAGFALVEQLQPDVVLMDLTMPTMDGVEATRLLTAKYPHIRVLVLTSFITQEKVFPALKAGASGYLLKDTGSTELIDGIRKVYQGEGSLDPKIANMMLAELSHPNPSNKLTPDPLTEREVEILRLVAQGLSNKEIADRLTISPHTARTHVNHILGKLHLASRVQATLYALRTGIVGLDEVE